MVAPLDGEELIRDIWRRWNSGERAPDPEIFDPELEIHSYLTGNVFHGEDGLRVWIAEIDDQFEAWELELDQVRELAADSFIAHGAIRARGRQSGVDIDQPASWRIQLRSARVLRLRIFIGPDSRQEAEQAAPD